MSSETPELVQDVVPSISIEAVLMRRNLAIAKAGEGIDALRECAQIAAQSGFQAPEVAIMQGYTSRVSRRMTSYHHAADERGELMETIRTEIDRSVWVMLMNESGMLSLMDAKARADWNDQMHSSTIPAVTREAIESTFGELHEKRVDIFERGVVNVFRSLSWCYKRNLPQKFGKRIIVSYVTYKSIGSGIGGANHSKTDQLDDLERVFHIIDGRPEPDHRSGWYHRVYEAARQPAPHAVASPYMAARLHKNGNAHIEFLRLDIVDRMNAILAKHYGNALPEPR